MPTGGTASGRDLRRGGQRVEPACHAHEVASSQGVLHGSLRGGRDELAVTGDAASGDHGHPHIGRTEAAASTGASDGGTVHEPILPKQAGA